MFKKLQSVRDVLLDATLRTVYDLYGEPGLQSYTDSQERMELDQSAHDTKEFVSETWRLVQPGEAFGPGHEFWMDMSTGASYVLDPHYHEPFAEEDCDDEENTDGEEEHSDDDTATECEDPYDDSCVYSERDDSVEAPLDTVYDEDFEALCEVFSQLTIPVYILKDGRSRSHKHDLSDNLNDTPTMETLPPPTP